MPHLPGVVSAGGPEATRLSQALLHRGAEAVAVVVAGERADRIRAERLPEAGDTHAVVDDRRGRDRRRDGRRRGSRPPEPPPDPGAPVGGLIDLQA